MMVGKAVGYFRIVIVIHLNVKSATFEFWYIKKKRVKILQFCLKFPLKT